MARVTVRYYGGAAAVVGTTTEDVLAETLTELVDQLARTHDVRLGVILESASLLVDGVAERDLKRVLPEGVTVDVLPPFAGG